MKKSVLMSVLLASAVLPLYLLASEDDVHVPVGTRPQTKEEITPVAPDEKTLQNEATVPEDQAVCGCFCDKYPPVYYSSSTHWLAAVAVTGDSLEIEDGSVWKISSYDGYRALNWRSQDPLLITQNSRWFSKYNYRIVNQNTGASLEANLYLGPLKNGVYTRYIISMNPMRGELMLSDKSHWEMDSSDASTYLNWALGDAVIIGYNSGWFSSYEGILINVNTDNYVLAKQF